MYLKFHDGDGPVGKYIRDIHYPDFDYKGILIEVGAGHPEHYSFSKHFNQNGWRCILFDPNPKYCQMHRELENEIYECAVSDFCKKNSDFYVVTLCDDSQMSYSSLGDRYNYENAPKAQSDKINIDVITLDSFFEKNNLNKVDIINIDTEGWELEVMRGFNTRLYFSNLIILENFKHDSSYNEFMLNKGYSLIEKIGINYIFKKI